jgi:myo-inositol-1(or 4)-monophosphatase
MIIARSWENERKIAVQAAISAGEIIKRGWEDNNHKYSFKSETEIVTEYDIEVEREIIRLLSKAFPHYSFVTEEKSISESKANKRWIIDPIDGTTNFFKGYPLLATSIALESSGEIVLGIVYNPIFNELFIAEKGKGATLNNKHIHVSDVDQLGNSLLGTGFPYETFDKRSDNMEEWKEFFSHALSVRCGGCASLDLCFVACGRLDGYWEGGLSAWDIAGGILIASEAGAIVTDLDGLYCNWYKGNIVAAGPKLSPEILHVLRSIRKAK